MDGHAKILQADKNDPNFDFKSDGSYVELKEELSISDDSPLRKAEQGPRSRQDEVGKADKHHDQDLIKEADPKEVMNVKRKSVFQATLNRFEK